MTQVIEKIDMPDVSPEMALAIYASTAASNAVKSLHSAGLMSDELVQGIVENLMICRSLAVQAPRVEEHMELMADMLLSGMGPK